MSARRGFRDNPALITVSGGALVATGAVVPWLELYGGLHQYAGTTGIWGKVMLAVGLVTILVALLPAARRAPRVGGLIAVVAIAVAVLAATRLVETRAFVASPEAMMLVPSVGPGLAIALAGSLLTLLGGLALARRRHPVQP